MTDIARRHASTKDLPQWLALCGDAPTVFGANNETAASVVANELAARKGRDVTLYRPVKTFRVTIVADRVDKERGRG